MRIRLLAVPLAAAALFAAAPTAAAEPSPLYNLVDAVAQRLQTAENVAAFKWLNGGPINDPPRVEVVLDTVAAEATAAQVDAMYVRLVFQDQINANEGIQYTRFGQWKLDPAVAPVTAADLSASRDTINQFNKTIVNEISLQRDTLLGPTCQQALEGAEQAVIHNRGLDPMYVQALNVATENYC
ncbi:chorismate mutase [Mycobacterium sp. MS1601]|uniref:chorismate mutase n=1 Tax=Mycobacterium sp. MS1601 TaxID=1936029 RepID=UPI0009797216|nr:chorismate mutase [Mycobacterium sp. MS1601]AQA02166.1 chorismate mutase [Mycobacterium sp. MS1601]